MGARKGRRIAIVTVLAVIAIAGALVWLSRDHIRFLLAFESLGQNAQGYDEYRHRQTGIVFVSLPGGTFELGTPHAEAERLREQFAGWRVRAGTRTETVRPFLLAKYEVTTGQWQAVLGSEQPPLAGEDLPHCVSWSECREFCIRFGFELPTEAEWEYACRAGTSGPYAGTGELEAMAWYGSNSRGDVRPVGQKTPNDFGLHDMHGNVWEWCEDRGSGFNPGLNTAAYTPLRDRSLDEPDLHRWNHVVRGGSCISLPRGCRSASRAEETPTSTHDVGFRPVWRWDNRDDSPAEVSEDLDSK